MAVFTLAVSLLVLASGFAVGQLPRNSTVYQCTPANQTEAALRLSKDAQIYQPFTPGYKNRVVLKNTNYNAYPNLVALPANAADVVNAFAYAKRMNMTVSVKTTGADFSGRAAGDATLHLDMSLLKTVRYDPRSQTVTAGGGAVFGDIQSALVKPHGRVAISGQLTFVGAYGCLSGGCHGPLSRQHGLGADNVVNYVLVDPRGRLVMASNEGLYNMSLTNGGDVAPTRGAQLSNDSSLFWAMRGGGGGVWGAVVQMTLRTYPAPKVVQTATVSWPQVDEKTGKLTGMAVLKSIVLNGTWWAGVPNTISMLTLFTSTESNTASATFSYMGNETNGLVRNTAMLQLATFKGVTVAAINNFSDYEAFAVALTGNTAETLYTRNVLPGNALASLSEMTPALADNLVAATVAVAGGPVPATVLMWCVYGGAAAANPEANKTSISPAMRNATCEIVVGTATTAPQLDGDVARMNSNILTALFKQLNGSYVNEMGWQPGTGVLPTPNWQQRFWGPNYARLLSVKQAVDPEGRMFGGAYTVGWLGA